MNQTHTFAALWNRNRRVDGLGNHKQDCASQQIKTRLPMRSLILLLLTACSGLNAAAASPNNSPRCSIFDSIRRGDVAALRSTLNQSDQISSRDPQANTPLIYAAAYADVRTVRLLLEKGADANATNTAGVTALMRAAGDYDKVRLLLQYGAHPNTKSALGNTALMIATRTYPSAKTVDALLKQGADIKATNVFGASAILTAGASGDTDTLRLLLRHGADVNAAPARSFEGVIWGGGRSALGWAALLGDQVSAKLLLENGASINSGEGFGSPLSQAVWHNEKNMVKFLLEHGADPNQRDRTADFTALHWAASTDYAKSDIAELLLAHGADVNVEGGEPVDALMGVPQTALLLAQRRGQTELLNALLKAGAKPAVERLADERGASLSVSPLGGSTRTREAIQKAVPRLQETASTSAGVFVQRGQACNSCHQQYIPMMALGLARDRGLERDEQKARDLLATVLGRPEPGANQEPTFHPAAGPTLGYKLLGLATEGVEPSAETDAIVSYLAAVQGRDGNWNNPLPRPPIQTGDISATALAVHALQKYPLPCRKGLFRRFREHRPGRQSTAPPRHSVPRPEWLLPARAIAR
jgi:ankyrin repeat protein